MIAAAVCVSARHAPHADPRSRGAAFAGSQALATAPASLRQSRQSGRRTADDKADRPTEQSPQIPERVGSQPAFHPTPTPEIGASGAILIDAATGQVLYAHNPDTPHPMASTTKIMTALLFCEHIPETAIVTARPDACAVHESSMHLKPGEQITAHDLLYAMLLRSANDGCVAAADTVAGSEQAFVDLMNRRAVELGACNTHFMNSHGLTAAGHYTTARDLAIIARAALQEPRIAEVVRTKAYRIHRSIDQDDVNLRNHSHFLGRYPGADGVKTGWTVPAGHCYIGSATHNGWRLISVVLHSPDYVHETAELMNFGFHNFERHVLAKAGAAVGECPVDHGVRSSVRAIAEQDLSVVTPRATAGPLDTRFHWAHIAAPVRPGTNVGTLTATMDGRVIAAVPLVAAETDNNSDSASAAIPWRRSAAMAGFILTTGLVSLRYGPRCGIRPTTTTKGARRRRRRVASRV